MITATEDKKHLIIRLDPEDHHALKLLAVNERSSIQAIVTKLIKSQLKK